MLTFATGGGGNTSAAGAPVAGSDICLKTPADSVACLNTTSIACFACDANTSCPGGQGFYGYCCSATGLAAVNAFMEGTLGGSSSFDNQYSNCNDFSSSLRGGDGYETTITPSPEYYGGGGAVTQGSGNAACMALLGAVMSPGSSMLSSIIYLAELTMSCVVSLSLWWSRWWWIGLYTSYDL